MAQYFLGRMYYNGEVVAKDYSAAARWLRLSATQGFEKTSGEKGYATAQYILGRMYMRGLGVLQDYTEGIKLFRLAAEQGNNSAQLSLGVCYLSGTGVSQDYIQAHMWLNLAAVGGNQDAIKLRKEAERRMNLQQVTEAQRLAREWKPKEDEKGWAIIE